MRNIKMSIMYDGAGFGGWQRLGNQGSAPSVQGSLEEELSKILGEPIKVIGSGRTDAGVHAYGQVANFHTKHNMPVTEIKRRLNEALYDKLAVTQVEEVPSKFHSRYDAVSKTYEFLIDTREKANVFTRQYSVSVPEKLDLYKMKQAAEYLIGEHDFAGFSTDKRKDKNTVRKIYEIEIFFTGSMLHIIMNGNGFLYNMVRIIVGTLIEVGIGKRQPESILDIIETKDRQLAGPTMSSQGLFLKQVFYV